MEDRSLCDKYEAARACMYQAEDELCQYERSVEVNWEATRKIYKFVSPVLLVSFLGFLVRVLRFVLFEILLVEVEEI